MSRVDASKSGMSMWPGSYSLKWWSSDALLADIVSAAAAAVAGGGGREEGESFVLCCVCGAVGYRAVVVRHFFSWYKLCNKY